MLVLEYLTENFKLASDANAGTLIADPPASPDATVAAVADTRTVKAADTADTQATPVAADEGAVAAHDVAITPDGGMSDLTISGLPSDFALTENEGDEPTVHPRHHLAGLFGVHGSRAAWVGQGPYHRGERCDHAFGGGPDRGQGFRVHEFAHDQFGDRVGWQFQRRRCSPHSRRYSGTLVDHRYRRDNDLG